MKKILITNGSGGCGKDTFAELLAKYITVCKISSIDFVKEMVSPYTTYIDISQKTDKYRKLLCDIKQAFIKYNNTPFMLMTDKIEKFLGEETEDDAVLIIDIREPKEIEDIVNYVKNYYGSNTIVTILLTNTNVQQITTNLADNNVFNYIYDYYIDNSGTLNNLENSAIKLVKELYKN